MEYVCIASQSPLENAVELKFVIIKAGSGFQVENSAAMASVLNGTTLAVLISSTTMAQQHGPMQLLRMHIACYLHRRIALAT